MQPSASPARPLSRPLVSALLFVLALCASGSAARAQDDTTLSPPLSDPLSTGFTVDTPTGGLNSEVVAGAGSLTITQQRSGISDPTGSLLEDSLRSPYVKSGVNGDPDQVFNSEVMVDSPRASTAEFYSGSRAAFQPAFSGTLVAGFRPGTGSAAIASGFGAFTAARVKGGFESNAFERGPSLQEFATTGAPDASGVSSGLPGTGGVQPGTVGFGSSLGSGVGSGLSFGPGAGAGFGSGQPVSSGGSAAGAGQQLAGYSNPLSVYTDPTALSSSLASSAVVTDAGTLAGQTSVLQPGRLLPIFTADTYAGPGGFPDSTRGTAGSPPEFGGIQLSPLISFRGLTDSPFQSLSSGASFLRPSLATPLPRRTMAAADSEDSDDRPRTPAERRARMEAILAGTPINPRIPRFEQEREERLRGIHNRPGERQPTVTLSTSTLVNNNQ